jgi:hypothetical protein
MRPQHSVVLLAYLPIHVDLNKQELTDLVLSYLNIIPIYLEINLMVVVRSWNCLRLVCLDPAYTYVLSAGFCFSHFEKTISKRVLFVAPVQIDALEYPTFSSRDRPAALLRARM